MSTAFTRTGTVPAAGTELAYLRIGEGAPLVVIPRARVRALVLLNPAPPFAPELREQFGKDMTSRRTPEDADELERIKASSEYEAGDVAAVERYYQVLYVPFFNDRQVALSTQYRLTENRTKNRDTAQRIFADFGEHALPMQLGSIECPTLVIHGEHDPVPVASSGAIADAISQGQLVVIPGSSHYGFLESPETVAAAVDAFLVGHAS